MYDQSYSHGGTSCIAVATIYVIVAISYLSSLYIASLPYCLLPYCLLVEMDTLYLSFYLPSCLSACLLAYVLACLSTVYWSGQKPASGVVLRNAHLQDKRTEPLEMYHWNALLDNRNSHFNGTFSKILFSWPENGHSISKCFDIKVLTKFSH